MFVMPAWSHRTQAIHLLTERRRAAINKEIAGKHSCNLLVQACNTCINSIFTAFAFTLMPNAFFADIVVAELAQISQKSNSSKCLSLDFEFHLKLVLVGCLLLTVTCRL